jgi:hypothetical protein
LHHNLAGFSRSTNDFRFFSNCHYPYCDDHCTLLENDQVFSQRLQVLAIAYGMELSAQIVANDRKLLAGSMLLNDAFKALRFDPE